MMKKLAYFATILAGALATACSGGDESVPTPTNIMALTTQSEFSGTDPEIKARLLFWRQSLLSRIGTGNEETWYVSEIATSILPHYAVNKYSTGRAYPPNNEPVYAAGFIPSTLEFRVANNYAEFVMPNRDGTDSTVMVSNGINGTNQHPFDDPLTFTPATVRFTIYAQRHENMGKPEDEANQETGEHEIFVRNVTVTFPITSIPNVLRWNKTENHYESAHSSDVTSSSIILNYKQHLLTETRQLLGVCYLLPQAENPNGVSLVFESVSAIYSVGDPDADNPPTTWSEKKIKLITKEGTPVKRTRAGESYEITLIFSQSSFDLTVQEEDWIPAECPPVVITPPKQQ